MPAGGLSKVSDRPSNKSLLKRLVDGVFSRGTNGSDKQCSQERFLTQTVCVRNFWHLLKETRKHKAVDLQVDMISICEPYQQNCWNYIRLIELLNFW